MGIVGFAVEDFERVPCVEDAGVLVSPPQILFPREVLCACKAFGRAYVLRIENAAGMTFQNFCLETALLW